MVNDKLGQLFLGTDDEERPALLVPAGGTSYAVYQLLFVEWQMVVDDVLDVGDVESAAA